MDSVQQVEFLHSVLEISSCSEPKIPYIAHDIVQGDLKTKRSAIEYLIDARPSTQCEVAFNRLLLVDIYVQFDDKVKLLDEPRDV